MVEDEDSLLGLSFDLQTLVMAGTYSYSLEEYAYKCACTPSRNLAMQNIVIGVACIFIPFELKQDKNNMHRCVLVKHGMQQY